MYLNQIHLRCDFCPPGRAHNLLDQRSCPACLPGTFASTPGSSDCSLCLPGFAQPLSAAEGCTACPPGKSAGRHGETTCLPCSSPKLYCPDGIMRLSVPVGSYSLPARLDALSLRNATAVCPSGSYCSEGLRHPCEEGTYSVNEGSVACTEARPGFYATRDGTEELPCSAGTFFGGHEGVGLRALPAWTVRCFTNCTRLLACIQTCVTTFDNWRFRPYVHVCGHPPAFL